MSDSLEPGTRPVDGVRGIVDGAPVTDDVIGEPVENAAPGFPGAG